MIKVSAIPAFNDNYIWLLHRNAPYCVVVDPGDALPVLKILNERNMQLAAILITHHHYDHSGGISELLRHYSIPVYGPGNETIRGVTHPLVGNEQIFIKEISLELKVISIPGHTRGHIAYVAHQSLFCGDTLFTGGCGRVFEGTHEQMYHSLCQLRELPDDTLVYCGHEYTQANLRFAVALEPNNSQLLQRIRDTDLLRQQNKITVPASLELEKNTNPFLRCDTVEIQNAASEYARKTVTNPVETFKIIREWKNIFK